MADKHYIIATQTGYLVDDVTGYPYEFHSKEAAVKALAEEVKAAVKECRRSHKSCAVVGSARSGSVQIKVGGRQGYHLWQRYVINERPGSRKPRKESTLIKELRAASKPVHATRRKSSAQLDREIAEVIGPYPYDDPQLKARWRVEPSDLRVGQRFDYFGQPFEIIKIGRDKARTIQIARRYKTHSGREDFLDHRSFPMHTFYQQHLLPIRD